MATFRKLPDGNWGVHVAPTEMIGGNGEDDGLGQGRAPVPGSTVTVTKRSGEAQTVVLGELVSRNAMGWVFKIAPRAAAPATPQVQVGNLSGIMALFDRARSHLRYPAIVLSVPGHSGLVRISVAGPQARVPGSLNVASLDEYINDRRRWFGRVTRDGNFDQREGGPAVAARLQQLAANPAAVASEHGRLTGRCCFCNRPLEDERSTAVGYGPVCADHFGLPWGSRPAEFAASPVAA